jgi:hypothetical protein
VEDEYSSWRLMRKCPHCGRQARTLGTVCPHCGRSYQPLGLLDRIPLFGDDTISGFAAALWVVIGLALLAGLVYLFIQDWVAGTIVVGLLFVALVGAIGFSNWLAQR